MYRSITKKMTERKKEEFQRKGERCWGSEDVENELHQRIVIIIIIIGREKYCMCEYVSLNVTPCDGVPGILGYVRI